MSTVSTNQPEGTPTWIDLGVPDLDRAMDFYGAVFGWEFDVGPEEYGRYTMCLLRGRKVAALSAMHDPSVGTFWNVYLATPDCDRTARLVRENGGTVPMEPMDVMDQGRMALVRDPVGAQVGLWQGRAHVGCELVNEPGALLRNDLVTADPEPARAFYAAVFGFTLDGNPDLPGMDFTFLRRPDGHEIGGIMGVPGAPSAWGTLFEVADADDAVRRAREAGGTAADPQDFVYGRTADVTDPFGAVFTVGSPPAG
ncbi:VOC family protein [Geodermatophilus sp. YIM 151500]|uniref:VOC family protein n=1 Tax=Geodermatophilus sp. YIM 151500 TaxID=2984531 RepID=UPI0021E4D52D|nr:VOC family protein [Geodermatophilus sp. YIM 151500]MCV2490547.1 VOC family protein [Geodermatophilus sp. YIM 151500]